MTGPNDNDPVARERRQQAIRANAKREFAALKDALRSGNAAAVRTATERFCRAYEGTEETIDCEIERRGGAH
jgi:hypothetical protein